MNSPGARMLIAIWAVVVAIAGAVAAITYDDDGTSAADQKAAEQAVLKLQDLPPDQGWAVQTEPNDSSDATDPPDVSDGCRRVRDLLSDERLPGATSEADSQRFRRPGTPLSESTVAAANDVDAGVTFFRDGKEAAALEVFLDPGTPACFVEIIKAGTQGVALTEPAVEVRPLLAGVAGTTLRITTGFVEPAVSLVFDFAVVVQGRAMVGLQATAINAAQLSDPEMAAMLQVMLSRLPVEPAPTAPTTTTTLAN